MGFICAVCGEKKSGFSMPYQILGEEGKEYPACVACSKIYDALGSKDCGELERAQADLQEKLRANPQMEFSLRELLQKRLLASRARLQKIEERQKVRDNLITLQKTMPQTTGYSFEGYRYRSILRCRMRGGCDGHGLFQRMERKRFGFIRRAQHCV